ncbi:MAG: flagellar basal-body MS-ring/collar protein FliF [Burkholderiaceae bacterium]
MEVTGERSLVPGLAGFAQSPMGRNLVLMLGAAAVVALMAGVWMWSRQPDYRVLFSNYSDRDGGAIVASLQQMNVPYRFSEGGTAILVPENMVDDARLKLAAQGLPKGGNVGFELMENQKLGVSQFLEQVNFPRALEGELARSIPSVGAVQAARVHLALPKASVFVRDQEKPTASVVLNLYQGRTLDKQQVNAIVHLVASSVPDLPAKNVTVIDQNGDLLSGADRDRPDNMLDPTQLKYVQELQRSIVRRIESIITPIVGAGNVRAEATADVDFTHSEQAAEIYKPNQTPNSATIRSQQTSESVDGAGGGASGIPGALTNQPPHPATAPLTAPPAAKGAAGALGQASGQAQAAASTTSNGATTHRESTTNYEIDKTVRYVQQPMGGVKRLSVAVVVNYRKEIDKAGKTVVRPLSDTEKQQITDLVKEAMGFNQDRGDSVNVVNSPFAGSEPEKMPDVPVWKRPETVSLAMQGGKYLLAGIVLLYLFFGFLRPTLKKIANPGPAALPAPDTDDAVVQLSGATPHAEEADTLPEPMYRNNLEMAKQLSRDDPKLVANVVRSWVSGNE